jgi:lipopolysaccharide transport system permease protein
MIMPLTNLYSQSIDLLWALTLKEFTARYKRAAFGLLWVLLNPLLQMIVIGFIFSYFVKIPNYFLFLFSGLLPWEFFSLSLSKSTPSLVYERALLQKAKFSHLVIPFSIILSNFISLLISEVLFISVLLFIAPPHFSNLPYLLLALIWVLVFTLGISLLTCSLNVRFRDVAFFIQTMIILWFYTTPILYSFNLIPSSIQSLMYFNPLAAPFTFFHTSLANSPLPPGNLIWMNLCLTLIIIALGTVVYRKEKPYFVDWM